MMHRTALRDVVLQRCANGGSHGHCWCRSARSCLFYRCQNCDMPIDDTGKALLAEIDNQDYYAGPCPYCNGPMPKH